MKVKTNEPLYIQDSNIRTEFRISWRQTGHLGATSFSTDMAHPWQHTRCPHGMKTERLLLIRHMTHNCPSGTSSISSSGWGSTSPLIVCLCCWRSCLCCCHCFHLFQFLRMGKIQNCLQIDSNRYRLSIISFPIVFTTPIIIKIKATASRHATKIKQIIY